MSDGMSNLEGDVVYSDLGFISDSRRSLEAVESGRSLRRSTLKSAAMAAMDEQITVESRGASCLPVTVLSGFLGCVRVCVCVRVRVCPA